MIFFNLILKDSLSPNQFYLLSSIEQSIATININLHQELRKLIDDEWIKLTDKVYILQPKAHTLISKVNSYFKLQKNKTNMQIMGNDFNDNINTYVMLFPKGKLPSGKPARCDKKNLETNFRWFFDNYSYSWDIVLKATSHYIDEYEKTNYLYMRTSQYFIRKKEDGTNFASEMANYCSIIESGDDLSSTNHFKENVV